MMIENKLSPNSRVWVYQSVRSFSPSEAIFATEKIAGFTAQWTSHREKVHGDGVVLYNRFIVLMADEQQVGVGGCSVDSSVHFIQNLQKELNTNFFDRWNIAYVDGDEVKSCNRDEFSKLVVDGTVNDETIVFNNLVQTKADFETKWKVPYRNSWMKNLQTANVPFASVL